ncbi:hypothetical protein IWW49_000096 [Coemansia sp. RSA 1797]|nr:hypothetical protein IWW49_000096 [Coemansia sp. RSA 1797]
MECRSAAPYYGFMIMNRLGLDNYTELLSADMSFQTSDQIVIYTSASNSGIVGIWIYEEVDRKRVPEQLSMCCANANSAALGAGMQYLYPRDAEEEGEFQRMYPRSRSNSRKDGGIEQANGNALANIINRTRQQHYQQQNQQQQSQPHYHHQQQGQNWKQDGDGGNVSADLMSKLQAIGLGPTNGAGSQPANTNDSGLRTLPADPAIILARKSVNPQDMNASSAGKAAGLSEGSAFKSPLPVPTAHSQAMNGGGQAVNNGQAMSSSGHVMNSGQAIQLPVSPSLHPAPSPFPPSTIATPLPGQGPLGASAMTMQQQPAFWHMHGGAVARSAHASPAPPNYGPVAGMFSFPQMPAGTPQPSMPMAQMPMTQVPMGQMPMTQPPMTQVPMTQTAQVPMTQTAQVPMTQAQQAGESIAPSVAQNLAEQLVSLVRQRMGSVQGGSTQSPEAAPAGPENDAVRMQRDYCREWLVRVIRADDELVDAFARRFPPPIFAQQQPMPPQ